MSTSFTMSITPSYCSSTKSSKHGFVRKKSDHTVLQPSQKSFLCYQTNSSKLQLDPKPKKECSNSGKLSRKSSKHSFSSESKLSRRHSEHSYCRPKHSSSHHHDYQQDFLYSTNPLTDYSSKSYKHHHQKTKVFDMKVRKHSSGLSVVTKTVRKSFNSQYDPIDLLISNSQKTKQVVHDFQRSVNTRGWRLQVIQPKRVHIPYIKHSKQSKHHSYLFDHTHDRIRYKEGVEEPFLKNIAKYTSNSGWYHESTRFPVKLLMGLCHYSYDWSDREFLICKIHADINWDHKMITIASPGLMSREGEVYGSEDLGLRGIRNFFYWNPYNRVYKASFKPKHTKIYYQPVEETIPSYLL